jgi:hypothetical protein
MKLLRLIVCLLVCDELASVSSAGCDLCGCYTPQLETFPETAADPAFDQPAGVFTTAGHSWTTGFYGALAEQFTHFGTLQDNGAEVANPTGQYLDSSITQLVAGYSFTSHFALQLNVPLIYRSFLRPEGFALQRGVESGLGDISLLAKVVSFHKELRASASRASAFDDPKSSRPQRQDPYFTFSALLLAGIKFPTGDTSRLKEEFNEMELPGAPLSGIHGHDLTLGTGSYDGILGGQTSLRYWNWFFQGDLQFALRSEGSYQYRFANDISWSGGPGYYLIRRRDTILGLQFGVSGEHKDLDRFQGQPAQDTGITSVFLGPRVVVSYGKISAELAVDLPVSIDNTALQVVPDYRIRTGFALRF